MVFFNTTELRFIEEKNNAIRTCSGDELHYKKQLLITEFE